MDSIAEKMTDQNRKYETEPDSDEIVLSFDIRKIVISLFIIWHIFAVTVWLLPNGQARNYLMQPALVSYMNFAETWQVWTMFSPNPMRSDIYISAKIDYPDGTHKSWNLVRMHDLSYVERYQRERFRKMTENANLDSSKRVWPYLLRYAALQNERPYKASYPMTVHLYRNFRNIPDIGTNIPAFTSQLMTSTTFQSRPKNL